MSDSSKRLTDLEEFLFGSDEQPLEDVLANLRQAGIDTDEQASRVRDMVEEKRRKQLQTLPGPSVQLQQLLTGVSSMPHELLFATFDKLRDGELGKDLQNAAKARLNEDNSATPTEEELRLWLEEVANSQDKSEDQ